jgi:hypothetical protein
MLAVLRILCEFFIEPPPDAQRKERQGAGKEKGRGRGIWDSSGTLHLHSFSSVESFEHSESEAQCWVLAMKKRGGNIQG